MAAPTSQNKAYGTVHLAAAGAERTRVRLSVSTPLNSATGPRAATSALLWAIHPGRCGSGSLPLVGVERFPPIDLSGAGRGELDSEMALRLPETGTFHVNVFWGRQTDLQDVMTCANLRRESN